MTDPEPFRARLAELQADAQRQLEAGDTLDAGLLALAAHAGAVLAQLDIEAAAAVAPEPDARAVLLDDNATITLAVFTADRQSAAAVLSPVAAVRLARRLLDAAARRL